MKRILIYAVTLAAALAIPREGTDVGKLKPVEAVRLRKENGAIIIETDTGDSGIGRTTAAAFENLEATTSGVVFLDTADYLLIEKLGQAETSELAVYLKPSVRICNSQAGIDLAEAAEYLTAHHPGTKLKDYTGVNELESLQNENGRLILRK